MALKPLKKSLRVLLEFGLPFRFLEKFHCLSIQEVCSGLTAGGDSQYLLVVGESPCRWFNPIIMRIIWGHRGQGVNQGVGH